MNKYVAFLRAVNVGGRFVKMDALSAIFESMKLKNVKTFIQSGNVIFETAAGSADSLSRKIEKKLSESLGYEVKAMLRTPAEINEIIENNPFKNIELDNDIRLFIALLSSYPDDEAKKIIGGLDNKNETYRLYKNTVYCLIKRDKKTGGFFVLLKLEKIIGIPLTTRNINTLIKINNLL